MLRRSLRIHRLMRGRKVIDRLLASPQYGERWGRIGGCGALCGFGRDCIPMRSGAIRIVYLSRLGGEGAHEDLPYDQFLVQQMRRISCRWWEAGRLAAMGF